MKDNKEWSPSDDAVEALCADVEAYHGGPCPRGTARFFLTLQHEREAVLLDALRFYRDNRGAPTMHGGLVAVEALRQHERLTVKRHPELLDAARDMVDVLERGHWTDPSAGIISHKARALRAAVNQSSR